MPSAPTRSAASTAPPTAARPGSSVLYKDADTGASDVCFDPTNPHDPLRRPVADAAAAVGADQRRPRQRPVRLPRRRRHLEAARAAASRSPTPARKLRRQETRGLARRHLGQGRRGRRPVRRPARLRPDRGGEGRPVPLATTAATPGSWSTPATPCASGPGTSPRSPSIRRTPTSSGARRCRCSRASTAARRFMPRQGAAPRRPPRHLDRPEQPAAA